MKTWVKLPALPQNKDDLDSHIKHLEMNNMIIKSKILIGGLKKIIPTDEMHHRQTKRTY
jgi:hypothetical protein